MYEIKKKILAFLLAGLMALSAVGCSAGAATGSASGSASASIAAGNAANTTTPEETSAAEVTAEDTNTNWSEADASAVIALSGNSIEVSGAGAAASGTQLTITAGGLYVLSGTLAGGQILVNAPETDTVRLVLNGVDITGGANAAIYEASADKLIVTLAEGTQNNVADAASYTYADTTAEEPDATLFAKHDLTINGTGALTVNAGYNNGIGTKDDLVVAGGNLTVTAANHGIRGRDSVTVLDGTLVVNAGSDGIQANNDEDAAKGWINLAGGSYTVTAANDGIQAETTLTISAGEYTLITGGGHTATPTTTDSDSFKGLKGGTSVVVTGGKLAVDSYDDTIHSNGNITIAEGTFALASGDDAVHADGDLTVSGGTIDVSTCYEGLEAATMTISDGVINIVSTDDGINIAGGNDTGTGGFGPDNFNTASSADQWLLISGGTITVTAGSDAIDINGSGEMTGGTVDLTAATLGEGQTLDVDLTWTQTGGDLTETGGSGMGGGPGGRMGGEQGGAGGQPPPSPTA